jgi:hypothetical protein
MLIGMRYAKVQADLVQKIRLRQCNALGSEIPFDVKNQAVRTFLETFVVIKRAIWVTPVMVERERLDQSSATFVRRKKGNPHASSWSAMHGV